MDLKCPFCGKTLGEHEVGGNVMNMPVLLCEGMHSVDCYIKGNNGKRYVLCDFKKWLAVSCTDVDMAVHAKVRDASTDKIGN